MTSQPPVTTAVSSKPPVELPSTTHLDPGAYVRGTDAITLGDHTLVHPRAQLISVHGPLSIGDHCIISEKAIIAGPIPSTSTSTTGHSPDPSTLDPGAPGQDQDQDRSQTTIHSHVHIHPSATIYHNTTINSHAVIESHATILPSVSVGAHSKICPGITVDHDVPDWTVVYGAGDQRRRRPPDSVVEAARLKSMDKEREAATVILRNAARMASLARKK